jgi:E3 ubiquitin-protein ligase UBR4
VEQAEGVLVAIVQQSIEFALCYLEKSGFDDDDLGIQVCLRLIANPEVL